MQEATNSENSNESIPARTFNIEIPLLREAPQIDLKWIIIFDEETGKPVIIDEDNGFIIEDENGAWGGRYGNRDGYHYIHNNKGSAGKWKGDNQSNGERKGSGGRY